MTSRTALRSLAAAASSVALLALAACSGTSATDLRDESGGATGASSGAPGTSGDPAQSSDGTSPSASGSSGGASGTPGTTTPAPAGPPAVEIRNLSFAAAKSHGYAPNAIEVTFALVNRMPMALQKLQEITLTFDGQERTFPATCDGPSLPPSGQSTVLTIRIEDNGTNGYAFPSCGSGISGSTTRPWGEKVQLELRGLLADATPWKASASGTR